MSDRYADVLIIGGGIVGTAIARELSHYQLKIILVEKEADVSFGTSKASSAIVHPGFPEKDAPLKSELLLAGNTMFDQLTAELDISFKKMGELTIARNDSELKSVEEMKKEGEDAGVKDLEIISRQRLRRMEPNVTKKAVAALYVPTAGAVDPFEVTIALEEKLKIIGQKGVRK